MNNSEGTRLLQSLSDALAQLAESVSPFVVNVNTPRRTGSGVVWSNNGHIVTANHVVGRAMAPVVTLSDGREYEAKVLGRDVYSDIALLKIQEENTAGIQHGDSNEVKVGQFVLALANALGRRVSATSGIITSQNRDMRGWWGTVIENALVSDAKLMPGYSGGPLVDVSGKMLGMNVAYFAGRGVAVSVNSLTKTVGELLRDGRIRKGFLGVIVEPIGLPDELIRKDEISQETGLLVRAVEEHSPAKLAGVTIGDIILKLDNIALTDEYKLHRALSGESVGKSVSLNVLRGGRVTQLTVTPRDAEE